MSESAILEVFMGEAREILTNLESDVVNLEDNHTDSEIINRIFRYFHTLKGSSGIAGLTSVYEFSHKMESLLDGVRAGNIAIDNEVIDIILGSIDWIRDEIFSEERGGTESVDRRAFLLEKVAGFNIDENVPEDGSAPRVKVSPSSSGWDDTRYYQVRATFRENIFEAGIDPLMIMEDLVSNGTILFKNVKRGTLPEFKDLDPEKCYIGWDIVLKSKEPIDRINDVFIFVMGDNDITVEDVTEVYNTRGAGFIKEKKVGEILVDKGLLTEEALDEAMMLQEKENTRLGDILVKRGYASTNEVNEALDEQERIKKKIEVSTVRVDTTRLDNLLNLLGEIVIGQSSLQRIAAEIEDDNESGFQLKNALYGLDRTTREFQEQIMSIRMIPIGPTFEQFRRFVRDSARANGKEIQFRIEGGDTELDKIVIEKIGDPLKHMIRNAIDHALETPEEREAAGKPRAGLILLKAYHQEGNVFIEIIDDGRGVNIARVRQKAEEMGLVKEGDDVPKEKLMMLLFHPGFSTAEKVGELSGRGVGMDVVKTNIEELRGSVEFRSDEGRGTTIRIKLPLTLAIIDGMLVGIGRHTYIIPLLSIVESMKPSKENVKTIEGKGEMIHFRGEYVPLIRLYSFLGIDALCKDPWEALVIVVESGSTRVGLMVDDLMSQQQIVIKSLDSYITRSRAISGAAILGDGKVALILDIHGLVGDFNQV